jgi:hypothetical protein
MEPEMYNLTLANINPSTKINTDFECLKANNTKYPSET